MKRIDQRGPGRSGRVMGLLALGLLPVLAGAAPARAMRVPAMRAPTMQAPADSAAALRLTLGGAARLAAKQSASVQEAAARSDEAVAGVKVARSAVLPNLSLSAVRGNRTFNTASFGISFPTAPGQPPLFNPNGQVLGPVETVDVRGHLSETLFDWSAWKRLSSAKAGAAAAAAATSAVADGAAARGAGAYLGVLRADAVVSARTRDLKLARDLLGMARRQVQAGVGVALDVTRAETQVAAVRAQLLSARNDARQARLALRRALGVPLDTPLVLTDSLEGLSLAVTAPPVAEAVRQALARRPDLRVLDRRLKANAAQLSAVRAERLPSLSFVGDDGYFGGNLNHMLRTYSWTFQVSVPLFEGFRLSGQEAQQKAQGADLRIQRRDLRQQIDYEVRSAILSLQSARQEVDAARDHLRLSEQQVRQARERFRAGVAGNADVVTALLELDDARTQYIGALSAYQSARVALARTMGTIRTLP